MIKTRYVAVPPSMYPHGDKDCYDVYRLNDNCIADRDPIARSMSRDDAASYLAFLNKESEETPCETRYFAKHAQFCHVKENWQDIHYLSNELFGSLKPKVQSMAPDRAETYIVYLNENAGEPIPTNGTA